MRPLRFEGRALTERSPILRRLTERLLAPADMADVLERYVGEERDPARCKEALAALRRLRRDNPGFYLRATLRLLDEEHEPQACMRRVIALLRKFSRVALR
jgi:hypothetical protein